jgi:signal transduction histidine kinase
VVRTDAERLRVALVNLIVNARHAVEARGRDPIAAAAPLEGRDASGRREPGSPLPAPVAESTRPQVWVSTRAAGERVAIVVGDAGEGIDQADLARVFDPYFTTKRGGTGLGLPIARNIVEGLGGSLVVTSAPGRGTEMRLELPYTPPDR